MQWLLCKIIGHKKTEPEHHFGYEVWICKRCHAVVKIGFTRPRTRYTE